MCVLNQTDVMKPVQHIEYLEDTYRQDAMRAAVSAAVTAITDKDLDCRVLYLGAGDRQFTSRPLLHVVLQRSDSCSVVLLQSTAIALTALPC